MNAPEQYAARNSGRFTEELKQLVRFPSVSAQPHHRGDLRACAAWVCDHFRRLGLGVALRPTRGHPIIEARTNRLAGAPTVLIYGHYDVQPAEPLDLWKTPPFEPIVRDGKLYGRGASDNKGQFLAHVKAVECYRRTKSRLPVNVVFLIEGEEEIGSRSLLAFVRQHARRLRADTIVISDSGMYSSRHPTLTYATRGVVALEVRVDGPDRDLHSGVFGGSIANPALVLAQLLSSCVNARGHVTIPGFYDGVRPVARWERRAWKNLPFNVTAYRRFLGVPALSGEQGYTPLEQRWARPTFEINGLTSGYQGPGGKTIVPAWASAKITCRLVPDQKSARIIQLVHRHLRRQCPKSVGLAITGAEGTPAYFTSPDGPGARAARAALEQAFGHKPVLAREGGSLPILDVFKRHLGAEILLIGLGLPDDNWHSPNEKFDLGNFQRGIVMSIELLRRLGAGKL